jgi:hypothetical protein
MPACANCKHWAPAPIDHWDSPPTARKCLRIGFIWEATKDSGREEDYDNRTHLDLVDPTDMAWAGDGSSYNAYIATLPTFFCAHFEEKSDAQA